MRALRITGQATVHSTSRHVDFHFYAHTACNLRVEWRYAIGKTVTLFDDRPLVIAEPVDEPVDCMTCLVRLACEEDKASYFTNPCGEIELNK